MKKPDVKLIALKHQADYLICLTSSAKMRGKGDGEKFIKESLIEN